MVVMSRSAPHSAAQRARKTITNAGLTQRQVARLMPLDETKLSKTLAGTRRFTATELTVFAKTTGVTTHWLLAETGDVAGASSEDTSRRQTILDIAWKLFATYGYERVRISDIAAEAGLSSAGVIYYFTSKMAIFLTSLEEATTGTAARQAEILQGSDSSIEKLRKLIHIQLPDAEENRREWAMWMQFWGSSPTHDDVKATTQASYNDWYSMMARVVETAQADGWLPPEQFFTATLTALVDGLGIRIMSGVTTPTHARKIIDEFLANHRLDAHRT